MRASILAGLLAGQVPEPPVAGPIAWTAPPECPDRAGVERAIEARLGRSLTEGELEIEGRIAIREGAPRYRLTLRISAGGRSEVRSLAAERCSSLADATALLVAVAAGQVEPAPVEEVAAVEEPAEVVAEPAPSPAVKAAAPVPAVEVARPVAAERVRRGRGWFVRAAGGAAFGATPGVTGAIGLATGALWRRVRLEVRGIYLAPRTASRGAARIDVSLFAGSIHGCARPGSARVEVPLCGGIEVGGVRGDASGPGARDVTAVWAATVASAGIGWRAHPRVTASLAIEGVVRLAGPRFELRDPGPTVRLFEPGIVTGRVVAGVELRFGDPR
jgi:hypothetical protein